VLTTDQQDEFRTTGLLRLPGAVPPTAAEAMCDRLWEFLADRHAIDRDDRSTWTVEAPSGFQPARTRVPSALSVATRSAPRWTRCSAPAGGRVPGGGAGPW
jgi:hypothetical protein